MTEEVEGIRSSRQIARSDFPSAIREQIIAARALLRIEGRPFFFVIGLLAVTAGEAATWGGV
jgi:hypothetical protein